VRAVILAAGRGDRLRDVTGDRPKCLARVGGCSLLERQIRSLGACGIEAIAVVAGFRAADIRSACGPEVDLVINPEYESTNSLYSLWLARHLLTDGFVVLNSDVLFHDQLLWDLLTARDEDALLMAAARGAVYADEEMKIRVRAGCVAEIAKTLDPAEADGENVGIAKFGVEGAKLLVEEMGQVLDGGGLRAPPPPARGRDPRLSVDRDRLSRGLLARLRRGAAGHRRPRGGGRAPAPGGGARGQQTSWETPASCMSVSITSASDRSRSAPIPTISIRAGCTPRRSATSATASSRTPRSS
jgi:choline kinase